MCPSLLSFFFLKGNSPFYLLFFFFSIEVKNQRSRISAAVSSSVRPAGCPDAAALVSAGRPTAWRTYARCLRLVFYTVCVARVL